MVLNSCLSPFVDQCCAGVSVVTAATICTHRHACRCRLSPDVGRSDTISQVLWFHAWNAMVLECEARIVGDRIDTFPNNKLLFTLKSTPRREGP